MTRSVLNPFHRTTYSPPRTTSSYHHLGTSKLQTSTLEKYWRRVQHLTNEFWQRWKKEYLQALQPRPKWTKRTRNFQVGDVVLMKDENNSRRNEWPMGIVTNVKTDEKNTVRSVTLRTTKNEMVVRPINKLIVLLESPTMDSKTQDKSTS